MLNLSRGQYQGAVNGSTSTSGLLIVLTDYNQQDCKTFLHTHENPHLSFGLSGQMAVGRKSHAGLNTIIEQCSYVRAGEEHQIALVSPHCKNINLELEPDFFKRYSLDESDFEKLMSTPGWFYVMLRLYKELKVQDRPCRESIEMLVLNLIEAKLPLFKGLVPQWVQLAEELLKDNWYQEISLQQIASQIGVHPVTVSKYFARYFGCSLGEYRRRLKVERALALMRSTQKSLTEIAHACAFFDQSHFIRAFREATGVSPKQFTK